MKISHRNLGAFTISNVLYERLLYSLSLVLLIIFYLLRSRKTNNEVWEGFTNRSENIYIILFADDHLLMAENYQDADYMINIVANRSIYDVG